MQTEKNLKMAKENFEMKNAENFEMAFEEFGKMRRGIRTLHDLRHKGDYTACLRAFNLEYIETYPFPVGRWNAEHTVMQALMLWVLAGNSISMEMSTGGFLKYNFSDFPVRREAIDLVIQTLIDMEILIGEKKGRMWRLSFHKRFQQRIDKVLNEVATEPTAQFRRSRAVS